MRILIISQYYNPDPFRLHEAAEGLASEGHEVTVLTGTPNYVSKQSIKNSKVIIKPGHENRVKIIRVPTLRRRGGRISLGLSYLTYTITGSIKALFLKSEYDVIFVYQLSPILMIIPAWVAKKRLQKKIGLYCLDLWPESMVGMGITHDSTLYRIMRKFSIKAYNSVDYLAYTSKRFRRYFTEELKLEQKHYAYIPQFAEDLYSSIEPVDHDGINYVFTGNIGEAQSVETIVEAAALIKDQRIKWHIVGDGSSYEKCKALAADLQVEDRVFFYGRRPIEEMPEFYCKADALIVTLARNEIISYTLPGKVQSYMAAGIPLLVSASGETPDIVNDADCGLCCPSEDPEGLARIAAELLEMDRAEMGAKAKKYYSDHFTKSRFINSIEEMLCNVIKEES